MCRGEEWERALETSDRGVVRAASAKADDRRRDGKGGQSNAREAEEVPYRDYALTSVLVALNP